MDKVHKVVKGDTVALIAKKYGHSDWKAVWNAKENKPLVSKRGKPENIQPGDALVIPPNDKDQKAVEVKVAALYRARDGNVHLREALTNEMDRLKHKVTIFSELITDSQQFTQKTVAELQDNLAGMKGWAKGVDVTATLLQMGVSVAKVGSLAKASTTASGEALKKLNEEAEKEVRKLATDPLKDEGVKAVGKLKDNQGMALAAVGIVADSWDKMTSPSFWADAWIKKFHEHKSWSEAVSGEVGDDIVERIKWVEAQGAQTVSHLKQTQSKFAAQLGETQALLKECDARIKWNEQEAAKLS